MIRPRVQIRLKTLLCGLLTLGVLCGWLVAKMECPVCHADNVDTNGRCQLGDACPYFTNDWFVGCGMAPELPITGCPGHIRMAACTACEHRGTIRRLDWLRSSELPRPYSGRITIVDEDEALLGIPATE